MDSWAWSSLFGIGGLVAAVVVLAINARDRAKPATAQGAGSEVRRPIGGPRRLLVLLALPLLLALGLYWLAGRSGHLAPALPAPGGAASSPLTSRATVVLSDAQLRSMVEQASALVEKQPEDATAWAMLAHSYDMLGKFAESQKAYARLVELRPGDAQVLADYADALAVANGRRVSGKPAELVEKALAIDAKNLKALSLAGTAALERKDFEQAVQLWQRARAVSTDAAFSAQLDKSIAQAKAEAAGAPLPAETPASAGGAMVAGRVSLADDLLRDAPADASVFIFARPVTGSRMPVALVRKRVSDLPFDFRLDDTNSMVAGVSLSQFATVVIGARVSLRGDVMPQVGDMQGWSAPVSVGTQGIRLEISEVLK